MEYAHASDAELDLVSIARCRELLGDEADRLSDGDVVRIRQHADMMARVIVDVFLERRATEGWLRDSRTHHLADVSEWI